ncbi:MAG: DNA mismatch repair endonuclease MutL [Firmicutes bacterium]|nr:DNA mismatch repair endonuclease MutL [Bacillota bacterium]
MEEITSNQIAAGEVIERPASVVKELVENALDADASTITIEIRAGGKEYIRVVDNGRGIPSADVPLAFERHGTSKIRNAEDLFHILTLGFRGEALPSIAAVSELEMATKIEDEKAGTLITFAGGTRTRLERVGAPVGTSVTVRNLFYNTPARYKFLNQPASERRYIYDIAGRIALANPKVRIRLVSDGEEVLLTPGDGKLETVMWNIYGAQIGENLIPVLRKSNYFTVSGLICRPEIHRGNRQAQTFIVNGRVIDSTLLASALEKGYQTMLPRRRFPIAVVCVNIDPTQIDVNVHPAKREVRFSDNSEIYKQVMLAVRRALSSSDPFAPWTLESAASPAEEAAAQEDGPADQARFPLTPNQTGYKEPAGTHVPHIEQSRANYITRQTSLERTQTAAEADSNRFSDQTLKITAPESAKAPNKKTDAEESENRIAHPKEVPAWRVIGQYHQTYILVDAGAELWLIDQHVAHERVLYERFQKGLLDKNIEAQAFLIPRRFELGIASLALLEEWSPKLKELGFEVEQFGQKDCLVRTVPYELSQIGASELKDLILGIIGTDDDEDYRHEALVLMCCKGAVKAGERLTNQVMDQLLRDLFATNNPYTCPHGRPVIVRLWINDIHRKFGRL